MKTPYREYPLYEGGINPENGDIVMQELHPLLYDTRWRRKNRVAQLKHTIARLNSELAIFIEPENFALIRDALVTHAASSSDRNTELRCLRLLTSLAQA